MLEVFKYGSKGMSPGLLTVIAGGNIDTPIGHARASDRFFWG